MNEFVGMVKSFNNVIATIHVPIAHSTVNTPRIYSIKSHISCGLQKLDKLMNIKYVRGVRGMGLTSSCRVPVAPSPAAKGLNINT